MGRELQIITTVEIDSGTVAFFSERTDCVYPILFRKSLSRYHVDKEVYFYDVRLFAEFNIKYNILFESPEGMLSFRDGSSTIVFGFAVEKWWNENLAESDKQKYSTSLFQCMGEEYVLYYRTAK